LEFFFDMRTLPHQELIVVRPSSIHGSGVYAAKGIKRDTRIIEYVGEIISSKEADRRYDDEAMKVHHTFLFYLDEDRCIDAAKGGNESRFINHSCRPNCVAHMKRGRIYIYALKNIRKGDELTYDYNYTREGEYDPSWEKLYACRCGATNCRGTILQPEEAPAARPKPKRKTTGKTTRKTKAR
jgi:SET domain-containing protein